jgi:hypothetical protein
MISRPDEIAHDAINALAVLQGRLQLLRRRARSGERDGERIVFDLDLAIECLQRLPPLIDRLEKAASRCAEGVPANPPARQSPEPVKRV